MKLPEELQKVSDALEWNTAVTIVELEDALQICQTKYFDERTKQWASESIEDLVVAIQELLGPQEE